MKKFVFGLMFCLLALILASSAIGIVRVGVYNKGTAASGPFKVQWWPGENYQGPACSWPVDGLVARGGKNTYLHLSRISQLV